MAGLLEADGALVAATDPDHLELDVPTTPGWTVRDLIVHLGAVHRWAATFIAAGPDSRERFAMDASDVPDGAAVTGWYRARLDELLATLRAQDPDAPARGFAGRTTAAFWFRRQAHEAAVHRWDLQNATPAGAAPVPAALAVDGVEEWTQVFVPRFLARSAGLPDEVIGRTVHLHGTDVPDAEWLFELHRDGIAVSRGHAKGDAAVRGTASDLVLAVWRRVPLAALAVHGDAEVPEALIEAIRVT
ncbi:maleylpyruvate isomerase family mycothiol-dependent enzyme [Tsukamurella soli]|uniref:maleylpyruvate isomerase family mycothiol-dependent enzyme n=1 Tax=Tsukamurella soli TaxID=644556 RepID=UPI00361D0ACF